MNSHYYTTLYLTMNKDDHEQLLLYYTVLDHEQQCPPMAYYTTLYLTMNKDDHEQQLLYYTVLDHEQG